MYLVGFYSPKAKSGVTELSLSIYKWLKMNTNLSVAFISYGTLEKENTSSELISDFSKLSLTEQKRKVKQMKKEHNIIIYDASSQLSEGVLKLLPIVDRLFVVGEEHQEFAGKLHQIIQFNKMFDKSVKSFITHLRGNQTYILHENRENHVIGFNYSKKETNDIGQIIYTNYVTHYLNEKFIEKNQKVLRKIKRCPKENLSECLYELGIDFNKSMLFQRIVLLREIMGQNYNDALEDLFPLLMEASYSQMLDKFQAELFMVSKLDY
ncbi:hypothetical protein [Peribacillus alkalitolerans]|uniref:hypothetical protein n=1 Tax=Peribacillus alkalitolerans TaxID=1550385 RepID=UPI0013D3553B|nr:hypothetical protein [Peribacillus alkalitolerans]